MNKPVPLEQNLSPYWMAASMFIYVEENYPAKTLGAYIMHRCIKRMQLKIKICLYVPSYTFTLLLSSSLPNNSRQCSA